MAQGETGNWALFLDGAARYLPRLIPFASGESLLWLGVLVLGAVQICARERIFLIFLVNSAAFALIYHFVLQASFSHWYLANTYVTVALLLGAGLRAICVGGSQALVRMGVRARPARWATAALVAALLVSQSTQAAEALLQFRLDPPRRALYTEVGHWLAEHTAKDATVAYYEIGYLGYYSQRTIIDPVGLVTPGGLERIKRGELNWIFDVYEVDYYVHNPGRGRADLVGRPWFERRYRPVARFEQDGFRYGLVVYARRGVAPSPARGEEVERR